MRDMTGEPRSEEELIQAREAIKREIVSGLVPVMVHYPTIIDAINELLKRREEDKDESDTGDNKVR